MDQSRYCLVVFVFVATATFSGVLVAAPSWSVAGEAIVGEIIDPGSCDLLANGHPRIDFKGGWKSLFNGKDMTDWDTEAGSWVVEEKVIARKGGDQLKSDREYGDFILDLEFKLKEGGNSGVFIRHQLPKEYHGRNYIRDHSLEIQIEDTYGKTGIGKDYCGALYSMVPPSKNVIKKPGQWNRMTITARESRIRVILNGEQVVDVDLNDWTEPGKNPDGSPNSWAIAMKNAPRKGLILIQDYGDPIWLRNISIKEL